MYINFLSVAYVYTVAYLIIDYNAYNLREMYQL